MKIPSAPTEMPAAMAALRDSWHTHLQAERKSQHTIRTYLAGVDTFARWCHAQGLEPAVNRPTVEKFTAALVDMAQRHVRAAESRLAVDEAHKLNLGDL